MALSLTDLVIMLGIALILLAVALVLRWRDSSH